VPYLIDHWAAIIFSYHMLATQVPQAPASVGLAALIIVDTNI
jgi:hypothetical protein